MIRSKKLQETFSATQEDEMQQYRHMGRVRMSFFLYEEKGLAVTNKVSAEVIRMIAAVWLVLSTLLYSLQLNTGSFPKPLTEEEERHYLARAKEGSLEARNILIEHNMRLVAHIMNKG